MKRGTWAEINLNNIKNNLNVELEDEVLVIGNEEGVTVEDIASRCETINYEILCFISKRVERHYI